MEKTYRELMGEAMVWALANAPKDRERKSLLKEFGTGITTQLEAALGDDYTVSRDRLDNTKRRIISVRHDPSGVLVTLPYDVTLVKGKWSRWAQYYCVKSVALATDVDQYAFDVTPIEAVRANVMAQRVTLEAMAARQQAATDVLVEYLEAALAAAKAGKPVVTESFEFRKRVEQYNDALMASTKLSILGGK